MQRVDGCDDPGRHDEHRGFYVFRLQRTDKHRDPGERNKHRQQCFFRLRQSETHHDSDGGHHPGRSCLRRLRQPDGRQHIGQHHHRGILLRRLRRAEECLPARLPHHGGDRGLPVLRRPDGRVLRRGPSGLERDHRPLLQRSPHQREYPFRRRAGLPPLGPGECDGGSGERGSLYRLCRRSRDVSVAGQQGRRQDLDQFRGEREQDGESALHGVRGP